MLSGDCASGSSIPATLITLDRPGSSARWIASVSSTYRDFSPANRSSSNLQSDVSEFVNEKCGHVGGGGYRPPVKVKLYFTWLC